MWFTLLSLALATASPPTPQVRPSADQLVALAQSHLDEVKSFEARFVQRYVRRIARRVIVETGVVAVKKPDRMRWDYLSPEEKLFVTDGAKSYFYVPEDKQVVVSHNPMGAMGIDPDSPFAFLAGRSKLVDAFQAVLADSEPKMGGEMLALWPRTPQEDYDYVELEVGAAEGEIRRVVLVDGQGNQTEFLFEEIRENLDLPDALFRFTVPAGVELLLDSDSAEGFPGRKKP